MLDAQPTSKSMWQARPLCRGLIVFLCIACVATTVAVLSSNGSPDRVAVGQRRFLKGTQKHGSVNDGLSAGAHSAAPAATDAIHQPRHDTATSSRAAAGNSLLFQHPHSSAVDVLGRRSAEIIQPEPGPTATAASGAAATSAALLPSPAAAATATVGAAHLATLTTASPAKTPGELPASETAANQSGAPEEMQDSHLAGGDDGIDMIRGEKAAGEEVTAEPALTGSAAAAVRGAAAMLSVLRDAMAGHAQIPTPRWFDPSLQLIHTQVTTDVPVTIGVGDEAALGALDLAKASAVQVAQAPGPQPPHLPNRGNMYGYGTPASFWPGGASYPHYHGEYHNVGRYGEGSTHSAPPSVQGELSLPASTTQTAQAAANLAPAPSLDETSDAHTGALASPIALRPSGALGFADDRRPAATTGSAVGFADEMAARLLTDDSWAGVAAATSTLAAASVGEERLPHKRWFDPSFGLIATEVSTSVPVTVAVGDQAAAGAFELDKQIFGGAQDGSSYPQAYPHAYLQAHPQAHPQAYPQAYPQQYHYDPSRYNHRYRGYTYEGPNSGGSSSIRPAVGALPDEKSWDDGMAEGSNASGSLHKVPPAYPVQSAPGGSATLMPRVRDTYTLQALEGAPAVTRQAAPADAASSNFGAPSSDGPRIDESAPNGSVAASRSAKAAAAEAPAIDLLARGAALANELSGHHMSKRDFDAYLELLHINVETNVPVNVGVAGGATGSAIGAVSNMGSAVLAGGTTAGGYAYGSNYAYEQQPYEYDEHAWGYGYPPAPPAPPPAPPSPPAGFGDDRERMHSHTQVDWAADALSISAGERLVFDTPMDTAGGGCSVHARTCGPVCCAASDLCNDARLGRCTDRHGRPSSPIGFSNNAVDIAQFQVDSGSNPLAHWWEENKPPVSISAGPRIGVTGTSNTCECKTCQGESCTKKGDSLHRCSTCGSSSSHCHGDPSSSVVGCYFVGMPNMGEHQCDCHE